MVWQLKRTPPASARNFLLESRVQIVFKKELDMLIYEVERGNYWRQNIKLVVGLLGHPACPYL